MDLPLRAWVEKIVNELETHWHFDEKKVSKEGHA